MKQEFTSLLKPDENILWTGKPEYLPYIANGLMMLLASIGSAAIAVTISILINHTTESKFPWEFLIIMAVLIITPGLYSFLVRFLETV